MRVPVGRILKYVSASSPKGLQREMLKTQIKLGYGVNFSDVQFVKKKWYAWYVDNDDITMHNVGEKLDDSTDGN